MTEYGRYELIERIGQGALTEVFKAKRYGVEGFEKTLVVKRLLEALTRDAEFVQSFIKRAQLALRLSHSNVVHVLDLGEVVLPTGSSYFLATEFVTGATLAQVLTLCRERGQPLTLEMALYIAAEVCRGLDHAHRRRDSLGGSLGISHDDLTASNIFLSDEGEVKVSDFCTAALGRRAEGEIVSGHFDVRPAGHEYDLCKLGSLLYEMLRLSPPPPIAPESTFTGFGLPVDDLLARLLMGDPDLTAADAHEQLLMHAYACKDWVGAEQVRDLVSDWRSAWPEQHVEPYPSELPAPQASHPPPSAADVMSERPKFGDFRPFVGRSAETTQVGRRLAIVAHRKLQAIGVLGPPGIGKSRFVAELRRRLARGGLNLAFHIVSCPGAGREQPYSAMVAMLRVLFGISGSESADHDRLEVALRTLGLSGPRANAILCELGASPSLEGSAPPLGAAVERVLASLADDRMHVLAWDEAEQMDEASARLLVSLCEVLAKKRIAFLFAARDLSGSPLSAIEGFERVELGALDAVAQRRLIQVRLGIAQIPDELEEFIASRSCGNPMFAEELLGEAISSGAIALPNGGPLSVDLARIAAVPMTLEMQLRNRVRRLNDQQLEVLRLVARLDEWADVRRIAHATNMSASEAETLLLGLSDSNLIVFQQMQARLPTRLIENALCADSTPDQIAAQELKAAEALLDGSSDDARLLEQAAVRLECAGEPQRAAEVYERSARARAENARPERTVPLVLRALELIPLETRSSSSVAACIKLLADSPVVRADQARLVDMVRRLSAHLLARSDSERPSQVDSLLDLVRIQRATLHFHEAQQLLLRTQLLAEGDSERLSRVLLQLSDTQIALGDFVPAIETLRCFSELIEQPSEGQRHEALVLSAHAHAQAGDREAALALLEQAARLGSTQQEQRAFRVAQVRALAHALAGQWQESSVAAANAALHARALGRLRQETAYRHYEGEALTHLGQFAKAYAAFRGSLALARDLGSERWINRNRMLLAYLEGREGSQHAKRQVGECLIVAESHHESQDIAKGRLLMGLLLRFENDEPSAQRELQLARQVALAIGHGLLVSECDAALRRRAPESSQSR